MFPWKCLMNWALMEMSFCTFKKRKAKNFFLWSWSFYLYAPAVHSPWFFPPNSTHLSFEDVTARFPVMAHWASHINTVDFPSAELKAKLKWVKPETSKFTAKKNILGILTVSSCRHSFLSLRVCVYFPRFEGWLKTQAGSMTWDNSNVFSTTGLLQKHLAIFVMVRT